MPNLIDPPVTSIFNLTISLFFFLMASAERTESSPQSPAEPRKSYRRTRRRHERQNSADITPTNSVPSTPRIDKYSSHKQSKEATTSSRITTNGSTTFEEGEDFIPFVISDPSDDEPGPSRRRTDKTNERYRENRDATAAAEDRHDGKNGHRRDRKRKYEEYDDEYSNQKQRAEVGSRKCPWVAGLELNRCLNVAEM